MALHSSHRETRANPFGDCSFADADFNFLYPPPAVIGLLLCLYHVLRTLWGLLQLRVFSNWCRSLLELMKKLDLIENKHWKYFGDSTVVGWDSLFQCLDKMFRVNNTIVDNEFSGTDLAVSIARNKIGLSNPITWLITEEVQLCTVRWSGAFLCSFSELWSGFCSRRFSAKKELENLFAKHRSSLHALHQVTFTKNENRCSFHAVHWKEDGPYGTSIANADFRKLMRSLEPRKNALENVMGSYTHAVHNFRQPETGLVCALQYAQCLDEESFDGLLEYSDKFNTSNLSIARYTHGWELLVWQNRELQSFDLRASTVPKFPWGKLMVPLWDSCTNWRVLQASVHMDNIVISLGKDSCSGGRPPKCFFEHTRQKQQKLNSSKSYKPNFFGYTGCILEMVRSFLAEWMTESTSRLKYPDWCPILPMEPSEFLKTRSIELSDMNPFKQDQLNERRWEFQSVLQERIAIMNRLDTDLPASLDLILLFILAFPGSFSEQNRNNSNQFQVQNSLRSSSPVPSHSPVISNDQQIINMEDEGQDDLDILHVFLFETTIAPQNVKVRVSVYGNGNLQEQKVAMELICEKPRTKFIWQDWINCAMGYIWFGESAINFRKLTPTKADLRFGMLTVEQSDPEIQRLPGEIQVWKGWPFR